jgi:hypothetical protein
MANKDTEPFTAVGGSFTHAKAIRPSNSAMEGLSNADSWGHGAPNLLPVKFHDDSVFAIPVMRPEDIKTAAAAAGSNTIDAPTSDSKGRKLSFFHRKSSGSWGSYDKKQKFAMRDVTRREYLAHYAKDDQGQYTGTEDPAEDCILRGEDLVRYRHQSKEFGADVDSFKNEVKGGGVGAEDEGKSGKGFIKGFRDRKGRGDDTIVR